MDRTDTQTGVEGEAVALIDQLRCPLPVCPFSRWAPKHDLEPSDPCPVCGDYGDERSDPNRCRGADTAIMDEAATLIETLTARLAQAEARADRAEGELAGARERALREAADTIDVMLYSSVVEKRYYNHAKYKVLALIESPRT